MSAPVTIDVRAPASLPAAERETVAALRAGLRVVVIVTRDGARTLALHAIPYPDEVLTTRGDNAMRARHADPVAAVAPAFREMRGMFQHNAYKPERHAR